MWFHGKSGLAAVAYIMVFAVCAILNDLTPAFLLTAAISIGFLLAGIAYFPRFRSAFNVALPNVREDDRYNHSVRIAGAEIPLRAYVQVATCAVSLRHLPELVASGVLSIATIVVVAFGDASYRALLLGWGLFALEGACIAGAIVLLLCLRWADECRTLRRAHVALAFVTVVQSSLTHQQLRYEFADAAGSRFGGYTRIFGKQPENIVIVFYDPNNPDENEAHCSLNFHRLRVLSVAALKPASESANEHVAS